MDLEWIEVEEDLPIKPPRNMRVTNVVEVKLTDGSVINAFYNYDNELWYDYDKGSKKIPDGLVKAWRSK